MRTKNFVVTLCSVLAVSILLVIFGQQKPATIQTIVSSTHKQLRNFQDTLRDAETKTLLADEKYLTRLGFTDNPNLYPKDVLPNTSLPVIVTYVMEGQESQAVGLINNIARVLPNHTILIYNLGLGNYGLKTLLNYCNTTKCQVVTFSLSEFPSHVDEDISHAYRPLVIQDALHHAGAIFFMECNYRFTKNVNSSVIVKLFDGVSKGSGVLTWPMLSKNAVSTLTHKKMFEYFHTDTDNFLFLQMVSADALLIVNLETVHKEVMLPWVQCTLTQDCIVPIGAQSGGCRFNKKPQYRYSGCHSYDTSALNIVLGLRFKLDSSKYTYEGSDRLFETVTLDKAVELLKGLEQGNSTEGRTQLFESLAI